jgi:hypothetical protein
MRDKRVAMAIATLLAAFAVAHLMQFGLTVGRSGFVVEGKDQGTATGAFAGLPVVSIPRAPAHVLAPPPLPRGFIRGPRLPEDGPVAERMRSGDGNAFGFDCDRSLAAIPEHGAVLQVRLTAPCDPAARVEVAHAGLRFTLATSATGTLEFRLPAFAEVANVSVVLPDGTALTAVAQVPDAATLDRIGISAEGASALSLRVPAPDQARFRALAEGFVWKLGDGTVAAPLVAEVYSVSAGAQRDLILPHVEAEVTASNCGRDIFADAVRTRGGGFPNVVHFRLAMPACDALGDVLVLGSVIGEDFLIARN